MGKKKLSVELPKGGMSDLTRQVRANPVADMPADASEWQWFIHYLDDFKNVSEYGECVWLFREVKKEVERIKFESDTKLSIRQLVNAMLLAFVREHDADFANFHSG